MQAEALNWVISSKSSFFLKKKNTLNLNLYVFFYCHFCYAAISILAGDFGLARVLGEESAFARTYVGTPYYMSPEQVDGAAYDERSDAWALGCLVYEMMCLTYAKNFFLFLHFATTKFVLFFFFKNFLFRRFICTVRHFLHAVRFLWRKRLSVVSALRS